jgi:hypothetical protein
VDLARDRIGLAFLALVVLQAFHSVEEYAFKLYEVFPPMVYLYRDAPQLAQPAFIAFNIFLFVAGMICLFRWVWPGRRGAVLVVWIWIAGEAFNATVHVLWWIVAERYNPGLVTGILFVPIVIYLTRLNIDNSRRENHV